MGISVTTTWRCDRCGRTESFPNDRGYGQRDALVANWKSIYEDCGPNGTGQTRFDVIAMFCPECYQKAVEELKAMAS